MAALSFFGGSFFGGEFFSAQTGTTQPTPPAEVPAGRHRPRRRERYIVRHNGEEMHFDSLDAVQAYVEEIRNREELKPVKRRNKARKPVRIEIAPGVQQELSRHDLPNVAPMLKRFDFDALKAVFERLDAILRAVEEEDEDLLLI